MLKSFKMNLIPIFFYHISQVTAQSKVTTLSQKCGEKQGSAFKVGPQLSF